MADLIKNSKIHANPAVWGLALSFIVSLATLVMYLAELDSSDETLFFLLAVLRYSSFAVCVCSIYLLIAVIRSLIRRPSAASVLGIILFFCSTLYGAGIVVINVFITAIAGGNR